MRAPIALSIYVSLTVFAFAEQPAIPQEISAQWKVVYNQGLTASDHQNHEEALALFRKSWETAENDEARGASAIGVAQTFRHLNNRKDASLWYERARTAWMNVPNGGGMAAAASLNLADIERSFGDYVAAERTLRDASASPCNDARSRILLRNDLADLLREEGRSIEARPLFQQTLDSPDTASPQRVTALIGLADIGRQDRAWEQSIALWNQALDLSRSDHDSGTEAIELRGLASTWLAAGSSARAEPLFRRALKLMESDPVLPPEQIATVHAGLGELYRSENKLTLAEEEWTQALDLDRKALGESHPQIAWLMEMLADVFSSRGQFELAGDYATRASQIMSSSFGENSMPVAAALTNRALIEERANQLDAAVRDYARATAISRTFPDHRSIHIAMMQRYSALLKTMHRAGEAKAAAAEVQSFRSKYGCTSGLTRPFTPARNGRTETTAPFFVEPRTVAFGFT
jgi:tetratricopeptide (TPR) repeat protein